MMPTIAISTNAAWNIINFRMGVVRALQATGYRVVALAPPARAHERLEDMGIEHWPIAIDSKGISPAADLALVLRYWRSLRALRPKAFVSYTIKPNIYGSLAAHALGIPVINNISGLGTAFIRDTTLTKLVSVMYRAALARSDTVFFQNATDRTLFLQKRLVSVRQAHLLPGSGIDLQAFRPPVDDDCAPVGKPFTFLMVARLIRDKGVAEFVEAARLLCREHPAARFCLLGAVDVDNRSAIGRKELSDWVAEGVVDYLGEVDDVRPLIAAADCIVLPSYREGLPRTLLEGAALAKPLIATDVPGCRDIVEDGVNGFLCAMRDPQSLAEAMTRMISLPWKHRHALGVAGRALVEARFDERIVIARYLDAIARVTSA